MTISIYTLFTADTAATIYNAGLSVARALGLAVDSWRTGDPTPTYFGFISEILAQRDAEAVEFIKGGFLSTAEGDWLDVQAVEVYGVTPIDATYATPTVTLQNTGGGFWPKNVGDLIVKSTTSGKTFHNTDDHETSDVLSAGATVTFELEADEAGSDSSVGVDEIDFIVTSMPGVVVLGSTAAVALDKQSAPSLKEQCGSTLGALSPNGPADAYEYVCRNPELTGTTEITRAQAEADDPNGDVTIYVASASGAVSGAGVTAAQDAVAIWATPLTITPTVVSAAALVINVTATITGDDIPADFLALIEAEIGLLLASLDIGGVVATSAVIAAIHRAVPQVTSCTLTLPAANIDLAAGIVPTPGTIAVTEV